MHLGASTCTVGRAVPGKYQFWACAYLEPLWARASEAVVRCVDRAGVETLRTPGAAAADAVAAGLGLDPLGALQNLGLGGCGLGAVPLPRDTGRPVLLVGNHQLFGVDLPLLIDEFLVERSFEVRALSRVHCFDNRH